MFITSQLGRSEVRLCLAGFAAYIGELAGLCSFVEAPGVVALPSSLDGWQNAAPCGSNIQGTFP